MSKVILITGTSTGLGKTLAIQLAQAGHKVYATMRNPDKKSALLAAAEEAGVSLQVEPLDVQDAASIKRCTDKILNTENKIDVLINNAGAGFVRTTEQASESEIEWVTDVNYKGVVRCTQAVLPSMRKARQGQIINITSVGGLVGQPFNEFYCAAKFAVEGYTESLATYIQPTFGIQFTLVEPGGIATEFAPNVLRQFESSGGMIEDEYQSLLEKYISGSATRSEGDIYQSPEEVAQVVISCLDMESPPLRIRTSEWADKFCSLKTQADPTGNRLRQHITQTFLG